ncbi:DUF424 domain-containing protein [Halorubellus sp. JP-L1]|uniref:DUF424 domain-containing protein n=1 Tax=Halorubellus sp. JP-L1 TaxID=2715753 RepID=UPI00140C8B5A|nr:DUF424 family protein [Halorubellus sp. JP-L1]NHN43385.1 DUF424 domain-containing protein [Halorubellus sp. JP-L1]
MLLSERETDEGLLVAACDSDVLGETFTDGEISLTVTEEFYGGDEVDADAVVDALQRADVANLVGTTTVEAAVDAGIVDDAAVLAVEDTLHAQVLRLG